MYINYNELWKLLIDRGLKKNHLQNELHISPTTIAKMSKGQMVSLDTICKIAVYLNVDIGDLISIKSTERGTNEKI